MDWERPEIVIPDDISKLLRKKRRRVVNKDLLNKRLVNKNIVNKDPIENAGIPNGMSSPTKNSPWYVIPVPPEQFLTSQYVFQLCVEKNRTWKMMIVNTNTADRRVYCSGRGAVVTQNGQTYNGEELKKFRSVSS